MPSRVLTSQMRRSERCVVIDGPAAVGSALLGLRWAFGVGADQPGGDDKPLALLVVTTGQRRPTLSEGSSRPPASRRHSSQPRNSRSVSSAVRESPASSALVRDSRRNGAVMRGPLRIASSRAGLRRHRPVGRRSPRGRPAGQGGQRPARHRRGNRARRLLALCGGARPLRSRRPAGRSGRRAQVGHRLTLVGGRRRPGLQGLHRLRRRGRPALGAAGQRPGRMCTVRMGADGRVA